MDDTLKSLQKILDGSAYHAVRGRRRIMKDASYRVLTGLLQVLSITDHTAHDHHGLEQLYGAVTGAELRTLRTLRTTLEQTIADVQHGLRVDRRNLLRQEYERWTANDTWQLINAGDPCGT